ncbi:MAG: hypothetical protein NTX79_05425 [Candidatus Micrarchaeota archaeon]|nr:hypothetical protein [Candidatus Micrarchaeota archaeon]
MNQVKKIEGLQTLGYKMPTLYQISGNKGWVQAVEFANKNRLVILPAHEIRALKEGHSGISGLNEMFPLGTGTLIATTLGPLGGVDEIVKSTTNGTKVVFQIPPIGKVDKKEGIDYARVEQTFWAHQGFARDGKLTIEPIINDSTITVKIHKKSLRTRFVASRQNFWADIQGHIWGAGNFGEIRFVEGGSGISNPIWSTNQDIDGMTFLATEPKDNALLRFHLDLRYEYEVLDYKLIKIDNPETNFPPTHNLCDAPSDFYIQRYNREFAARQEAKRPLYQAIAGLAKTFEKRYAKIMENKELEQLGKEEQ